MKGVWEATKDLCPPREAGEPNVCMCVWLCVCTRVYVCKHACKGGRGEGVQSKPLVWLLDSHKHVLNHIYSTLTHQLPFELTPTATVWYYIMWLGRVSLSYNWSLKRHVGVTKGLDPRKDSIPAQAQWFYCMTWCLSFRSCGMKHLKGRSDLCLGLPPSTPTSHQRVPLYELAGA